MLDSIGAIEVVIVVLVVVLLVGARKLASFSQKMGDDQEFDGDFKKNDKNKRD